MTVIQKHRIAVIVPGGIGTGKGNIGVPVLERQILLLTEEFDITVFSLFPINSNYRPENFKIVSISPSNAIRKSFLLWNAFRKMHRREKFSAIHGFWILPSGFLAVLLGKMFRVKSVVSALGGDAVALPQIHYGLLRKFIPRQLILWTMRNATHTMALTKFLADNLSRYGLKREPAIVPWGIDSTSFSFRKRTFEERPLSFLHVGNLSPVKDQTTLVKAFHQILSSVNAHLTIIGEGPLHEKITDLIRELEMEAHVTILPPMPYETLPAYYEKADFLLHTSLSEGQSEVVTEAMSAGLLVCGTQVGLMYDLPENCLAVPVGDHHALAQGVLALLSSPGEIEVMCNKAREWTSIHDIHWTVAKTKTLFLS